MNYPQRGAHPRGGGGGGPRNDQVPTVTVQHEKVLGGDAQVIVEDARKLAEAIGSVKTAQVRNFYGPIVRIAESQRPMPDRLRELTLLRPRLHYMVERQQGGRAKESMRQLATNFDRLIQLTKSEDQLQNLYRFAEAVVAYAKKGD